MIRKLTLVLLLFSLLVVPTLAQNDAVADTAYETDTYSFLYPAGWVTLEDPESDAILVAPTQTTIDEFTQDNIPPSDLMIFTFGDELIRLIVGLDIGGEKPDLEEAANSMMEGLAELPMLPAFPPMMVSTMDDGRDAGVSFLEMDEETGLAGVAIVIDDNGAYIGMMAVMPAEDLEGWLPLLENIAMSLSAGGTGAVYSLNWIQDDVAFQGDTLAAVTVQDRIVIASHQFGLVIITPDGDLVNTFSGDALGIESFDDLIADSAGNLWILDSVFDTLWQVSMDGEVLGSFSVASEDENVEQQIYRLAITADDNLTILGTLNTEDEVIDNVWVWSVDGELVSEFSFDAGDTWVDDIADGEDGNIMLLLNNAGATIVTQTGEVLEEGLYIDILPTSGYTDGFTVLADNTMAFIDPSNNVVHFNRDGEILNQFSATNFQIERFRYIVTFAIAANGDLIVADIPVDAPGRIISVDLPDEDE